MSQYKKVVILGATSGIGLALAEHFVDNGSFVIVSGRREERLNQFVQDYGTKKAQAIPFDITKLEAIEAFTHSLMEQHPDIDCVIFNSGIQRKIDFLNPDLIDVDSVKEEYTTNYLSPLALTKTFLTYLLKKEAPTSLIYTGSNLGLVPLPRCANYSASKAALHSFLMCLREQLSQTNIKVVEILPPAVQTELHDAKHQPDIVDGHNIGMPLDEFTNEAWRQLSSNMTTVAVGQAKIICDVIEPSRNLLFRQTLETFKKYN